MKFHSNYFIIITLATLYHNEVISFAEFWHSYYNEKKMVDIFYKLILKKHTHHKHKNIKKSIVS